MCVYDWKNWFFRNVVVTDINSSGITSHRGVPYTAKDKSELDVLLFGIRLCDSVSNVRPVSLALLIWVWMHGKRCMFVCGLGAAKVSVIVFVQHVSALTAALKITQRP